MTASPLTPRRVLTVNLFELTALWGLAVVQPLLGVFGASAETFIANGITPHTILPIAIGFCIIPPLLLCGVELMLLRVSSLATRIHRVIVAVFLVVFFAQIFKVSFHLTGVGLVLIVAIATTIGFFAFHRVAFIGQWFRYLSVTPLLALVMFAVNTPSGRYALNSSGEVRTDVTTNGSSIAFVMFDEFPLDTLINADGQLDKKRFPNFYRLSQISTWYRNYSASAEATVYAVPAILSGKIPNFTKGPTVADYPNTLFTWLGDSYKMNVSEIVTSLCPQKVCKKSTPSGGPSFLTRLRALGNNALSVMRERIHPTDEITLATSISGAAIDSGTAVDSGASADPSIPQAQDLMLTGKQRFAVAESQNRRWSNWISNIDSAGCPCLNYIHMLLPHHPWVFFPDGTTYYTSDAESTADETPWENLVRRQRLALQAQFADKLIGNLLDKLESQGMLDTTQVVVVADHGMSLDDGYYRRFVTNDYGNYPSIMYPPLFIHSPGQSSGTISDQNVESPDIMSLVASGLESTWPWATDGYLPENRTGDLLTKKKLYMHSDNLTLLNRPDKTFVIDAAEGQKKLFGHAHSKTSTDDYLEPLYGSTPFDSLRGKSVPNDASTCACSLEIGEEFRGAYPLVYFSGVASGDIQEGDWIVIAIDGKVSGLSPVYLRSGKLRVMTLVKSEDFASAGSKITVFKATPGDTALKLVDFK